MSIVGHGITRSTYLDLPLVELDLWVSYRRVEVQILGYLPTLDSQYCLDDTSNACRALEMADIGLDRANQNGLVGIAVAT